MRHGPRVTPPEQLEIRILPTVKVRFNPTSGVLKITGDSAANDVSLDGLVNPGSLEVFINNTLFDTYTGVKSLKINLKDGDDKLRMSALDFEGNSNLKFGDGADNLEMDSFTQLGSGGNGPSHLGGFFKANFGNDSGDIANILNGVTFDGDTLLTGVADVRMLGDGSGPSGEFGLDVVCRSNLTINLSGFGDVDNDAREFFGINLYVQGETLINGSDNVERFMMTTSRFDGLFTVLMNDGNDNMYIDFSGMTINEFGAGAVFNGGDGNDTLTIGPYNLFGIPPTITGFETVS